MSIIRSSPPLRVDPATGLVLSVRQVLSSHYDSRPAGVTPDLIVVHGISLPPGEFGGPWIDRLFTGHLPPDAHPFFREIAAACVSAHVLIRRDGQIVQYVPFGERAWHAGKSEYCGRGACNDFSVGIELEGTDEVPMSCAVRQPAALIKALLIAYPSLSRSTWWVTRCGARTKDRPGESFDWPPAIRL
jgi:AmpD protein